jgi:diamine N-acetyltransferase
MEVELRRTTIDDLPYVFSAERHDDNRRFINVWPEEKHREALCDEDIEHLIIESKPLGQYTGFVILAGLKSENRSIEFMRIVVTNKGKGYGRATVRAIKRHAFDTLSAHRLWLDVKEDNTRARAVYEKEGFRYEGTLRECLAGPEGFESLVVMSMLQQEYHETSRGTG